MPTRMALAGDIRRDGGQSRTPIATRALVALGAFVAAAALGGCRGGVTPSAVPAATASGGPAAQKPGAMPAPPKVARREVILATSTSTVDSGLIAALGPAFQKATGYDVRVLSVGSGAALEMAERGDADVLLVDSPAAEEKFVAGGSGIERTLVMHNDFVVVGPATDPARVKGSRSVAEAIRKIADSKATFISRGDGSGTDTQEKSLWKAAGRDVPEGQSWYIEVGQGMGATLMVARERQAYTLADRATFVAFAGGLDLAVMFEGDPALLNVYHAIVTNPAKQPKTNTDGARALKAFLISEDAQKMIGAFGREKYGRPLFVADGGKQEPVR